MNQGRTLFAQVMDFMPVYEFNRCVDRYRGDHKVRAFSCLDQFRAMAFAQLTGRESLRDIEVCLHSMGSRLYHMGFRGRVARSTLADANETRDWRIYADFGQVLIRQARDLYAGESLEVDLSQTVYALDSTTIDLCLSMFPWARFRKHKGAVKMHTLLDLRGSIPSFVSITEGAFNDVRILDDLVPEPGSFYVMDRGYMDFRRLYRLNLASAYFVTRAKSNTRFSRIASHDTDRARAIKSDQAIRLTVPKSRTDYPAPLRRIHYISDDNGIKHLKFLTNNFLLPAWTIAQLYKSRWTVELFFKWIKQHLRIKAFYGTSANAVKTQIWIAISTYVLVAIMRKLMELRVGLYQVLQILSVSLLEKVLIRQALMHDAFANERGTDHNQLLLFDL